MFLDLPVRGDPDLITRLQFFMVNLDFFFFYHLALGLLGTTLIFILFYFY
jgi:hypothetical protein